MHFKVSVTSRRSIVFALILFLSLAALIPFSVRSRSTDVLDLLRIGRSVEASPAPFVEETFVRRIDLPVNDLVVDPNTQNIYASVPSTDINRGNRIAPITPSTGVIGTPVFIGSEPNRMAMSDNGQYIYVMLDGSSTIRRFDVTSQTAGLQISLGVDPVNGLIAPQDLAVVPGQPESIAIARRPPSQPGGIAIYDNGVQRPSSASPSKAFIAFDTQSPTNLYAIDATPGGSFNRMTVNASGVTATGVTSANGGGRLTFSDGRLYVATGQVFDPTTNSLFGTFTGTDINNTTPYAVDAVANRVYFLTGPQTSSAVTRTLRVFDRQTFLPVGTVEIPNVTGAPTRLVRWGANGLAFGAGGTLYLIQTSLVPSADPIPTPTPTPSGTPTPTPTPPVVESFTRVLPILASDLVYDDGTQKIYGTQPSVAGPKGNSILPFNPVDGSMAAAIFVGSEPTKLARSDNGQYLYVGLEGSGSVRRFDLATQTASILFSLGKGTVSGGRPNAVADIEVAPGNPGVVAVAMRNFCCSPSHEGIAVFENGVLRGPVTPSSTKSNSIEFSDNANTLYGLNTDDTEFGFRKFSVTPTGVTPTQVTKDTGANFGTTMKYAGGRIYYNNGRILDAESGLPVGVMAGVPNSTLVLPDAASNRVFFITGTDLGVGTAPTSVKILAYDKTTFLPLGSMAVNGVTGGVRGFIRWGVNGLAFATQSGQVFLIQSDLIDPTTPSPTPTPTPVPSPTSTPTPIPTPAAGELVQVALATNDLVVDANSQTLFASVPSNGGANGNSLTAINPETGTIGQGVFIGSEPNKLAISDDNSAIYVGLDGANAVRRFDVATRTAGTQFSLGSDQFNGPRKAEDIAVAPGQPNVVAVSRFISSISPRHAGVSIFDNGVERLTTTPNNTQMNSIEFSRSPTVLYGQNNETTGFQFRRVAAGACGLITVNTTQNLLSGFGLTFKVDNGFLFASNGQVVNPETAFQIGIFKLRPNEPFPSGNALVTPEVSAGKVYFLDGDGSNFVLSIFDSNTYTRLKDLRIPGLTGTPSSLVRWGANGLAFRTSGGQVFLLRNESIGGNDPLFTSGPVPANPSTQTNVNVTTLNGNPDGVSLSLTGALTTTLLTNSSGNATITNIPPCGGVTITPSKPNYVFSPASTSLTNPVAASVQFNATLKTIGFNTGVTSVTEGGAVTVNVTRNIGFNEPATVSFETLSGTASDRSDFNATFGQIQFAAGEQTKPITVLTTDDGFVEGTQSFTIRLKEPSGAELAQNFSTITVSITDNDSQPAALNPLSNAQFFVRQHYQDFLNRNALADPAGLNFWVNEITVCASQSDPILKANCFATKRINVSAAFFLSIEFQQTGYFIHRLYASSFPDSAQRPRGLPRLAEFQRDTQEIGRDLVVGAPGWEQKLEQNKAAFALKWVQRSEFLAQHPVAQTADQFVDSLFAISGATPTANERSAAITAFGSGGNSGRALALRSVVESQSVFNKQYNGAFVLMQYFGYLRRGPDEAPNTNFDGYQFWLDKLNQFGNFVDAEMVKAFLQSSEYQERFGPSNFDISQ